MNLLRRVQENYRVAGVLAVMGLGSMASAQTTPESGSSIVGALNLQNMATQLLDFVKATIIAVTPGLVLIVGTLGAFYFVWNKVRSLF